MIYATQMTILSPPSRSLRNSEKNYYKFGIILPLLKLNLQVNILDSSWFCCYNIPYSIPFEYSWIYLVIHAYEGPLLARHFSKISYLLLYMAPLPPSPTVMRNETLKKKLGIFNKDRPLRSLVTGLTWAGEVRGSKLTLTRISMLFLALYGFW